MVLSQTSVLGHLANVTRRVTLVTNPSYSTSTGSWLVNGMDADNQQWQIDLTALPPGVTKDIIKAGQQWFIERMTTYNRLSKIVGELDVSIVDFNNKGDLLVGVTKVSGTILPVGSSNEILSVQNGTPTWVTITSVSGLPTPGITQLTGDILASGTGSVAATLQATTNVENIISNNSTVTGLSSTVTGLNSTVSGLNSTISGSTTSTQTLTNKRITKRILALSANSATPAINSDSYDAVEITSQTAAITSFTSGLTGTPNLDDMLLIAITGTAAVSLTWGTKFIATTIALPTTTVSTTRLRVLFMYSTAASAWECVGVV